MGENNYKDLIIKELFKILKNKFPDSVDLLSIIRSYNKLSDEEVYYQLFCLNHGGFRDYMYKETQV